MNANSTNNVPRPEHPNPQVRREKWINLNGEWEYATDKGISGIDRELFNASSLPERITVPFCRESDLSGIGDKDFCEACWYLKKINITQEDLAGRVHLNIGACDYLTKLWINGKYIGFHRGGYISFRFDITDALKVGENTVVIGVEDRLRRDTQPGGKQSKKYYSHACMYTRTTGIWQTVWLEYTPKDYIKSFRLTPDVDAQRLHIEAELVSSCAHTLTAEASYDGHTVGKAQVNTGSLRIALDLPLDELHLWDVGCGRLYDLTLTFGEDKISSYFGMRKIECVDGGLVLNGRRVFQRLILDQGFYPDGIYTAPTEQALVGDIERSMAAGFNGARLHEKIFEPLFLYHCDRLGYIVWGEHANWGLDIARYEAWEGFIPEWIEALNRDYNHPAIIGWCPLNETQTTQNPEFVACLSALTRAVDPSRLYIDASGWTHVDGATDIMDMHCYQQVPALFAQRLAPVANGECIDLRKGYMALPTFISEYGGIRWAPEQEGWGYGEAPKTAEEFIDRFTALTKVIMDHPKMTALCYTQLTDVEQEVNGLYTYDRVAKFDPAIFKAVLSAPAAYEKSN